MTHTTPNWPVLPMLLQCTTENFTKHRFFSNGLGEKEYIYKYEEARLCIYHISTIQPDIHKEQSPSLRTKQSTSQQSGKDTSQPEKK